MSTWFSKTTAQVVSELETDQSKGLTTQQAEQRLEKYGPNALESGKKESLVKRFINQLKDPMIIVLLAAAVLSLISTGGEDWVEARFWMKVTRADSRVTTKATTMMPAMTLV